jgi:hypothetical protein
MLIVAAVALVTAAVVTMRDTASGDMLGDVVNIAYPLGDLLLATLVLSAVRRGGGDRTTMHLVLAGILAFAIADSWFAVVVTVGDFGLPYWLDAGWVLGYLLIALGAVWACGEERRPATALEVARMESAWCHRAGHSISDRLAQPVIVAGHGERRPHRQLRGDRLDPGRRVRRPVRPELDPAPDGVTGRATAIARFLAFQHRRGRAADVIM